MIRMVKRILSDILVTSLALFVSLVLFLIIQLLFNL